MRIFRYEAAQDLEGIVFGTVVNNNDLKVGIVLFKYRRKKDPQVFFFVPCTYDD